MVKNILQNTECKHILKDSALNSLQDRICLQNSLVGGSKPILSHPSIGKQHSYVFPVCIKKVRFYCYHIYYIYNKLLMQVKKLERFSAILVKQLSCLACWFKS